MKGKKVLKEIWAQRTLYSMLLPGIICLILFSYLPLYGLLIAFQDYKISTGVFGSPWVGFEQFATLFQDHDFAIAIRNTVAINLLKLVFCFPAPILFAIMLSELRLVGIKKGVQTLSYLPHFFTWVIVAGIFGDLLATDGTVNRILGVFGIDPVQFSTEDWFFWPLMVITGTWKEGGWNAIIYIAALSNINPELYEAADIDGAGRFAKIRYITLPALMPTLRITLLLSIAGLFNAGFDQIYLFQNPLILNVAEVLDTYIYKFGLSNRMYSYATAAGLVQSLVNFAILIAANTVCKKTTGSGLY
ncbi:MAG: ABC transporter permease subunit [Clostridiales bacterium]|nr:ABC transporter permease subunit [Clostridiales bacterium]